MNVVPQIKVAAKADKIERFFFDKIQTSETRKLELPSGSPFKPIRRFKV